MNVDLSLKRFFKVADEYEVDVRGGEGGGRQRTEAGGLKKDQAGKNE